MLTVGVVLDSIITAGGGFQHSLSTILLLKGKENADYTFVFFTTYPENLPILKEYGINAIPVRLTPMDKAAIKFRKTNIIQRILNRLPGFGKNRFDEQIARHDIDLLYFLSYSRYAGYTEKFNYIFSLWDLNHRDYPEFPLFHQNLFFDNMENLLREVLPKATAILVDSEISKLAAIHRYGIDDRRVYVQPFLPAESVQNSSIGTANIRLLYSLKNDYVYYPAQFWAHKNHYYILEGLKLLKEKYGVCVDAVFSGSDKGNLSYILESAKKMGISDQVHYIGFVENRLIPDLYRQALALVMPTYFGPTNMPPLEAFALGTPVIYADVKGVREQVEGAALMMDLKKPDSMAVQLLKVLKGDQQVEQLKNRGKGIVNSWTKENAWQELKAIFDDYSVIKKSWRA